MTGPFWTDVPAVYDASGTLISATVPMPPVVDPDAVRPSVDEIAALEHTRTVDQDTGQELGEFSEDTRPTAAEVEGLIDVATADVLAMLPPHVDPIWYPAISRAISLRASFTLEASYYRESASTGVGSAAEYGARFTSDLTALQALIPRASYVA